MSDLISVPLMGWVSVSLSVVVSPSALREFDIIKLCKGYMLMLCYSRHTDKAGTQTKC